MPYALPDPLSRPSRLTLRLVLPVLVVFSLSALAPPPAVARDGHWYVVASETKDDEKFVIDGPHGRFLCSAMTYCFGLDPGDKMFWSKNPWIATNEEVHYDDFARSCKVWECDDIPSSTPAAPSSAQESATRPAPAPRCTKATIKEPTPFLGNSGEVVVLDDGTVWKVGIGEYNYLYEYYASVTLCGGTLIVGDKSMPVTQLK